MPERDIKRRGFMFVLSSPSGAGKTTLSKLLLKNDDNLTLSVSVTTRPQRPGEEDGKDYFFVEQSKFDTMVESGEFLEYAHVFNASYGTPAGPVQDTLEKGVDVLFDIDWQGTHQLGQKARNDLVSIFILPPSIDALEQRLRLRGQDSDDVIAYRMERAQHEISHWHGYDYVIINETIDESLHKVASILQAERLRRTRQHGLENFVNERLLTTS